MSVRAVLFDFYGTLAHATSWGSPYEDILGRHGYELAPSVRSEWVSDAFDGLEHLEHSASRDAYVAWERSRLEAMARTCGVGDDDLAVLVDDLHRESKTWTIEAFPEAADVLTEVRARGVAVAICSNWDWDLDRAVAAAGLTDLVDVQVTSAQAGARKPHRRIFDVTLQAIGATAEEAVMVGDTWRADIEGPLALGMRAVHVARPGHDAGPPPPLPPGVVRAPDLNAVLELVPARSSAPGVAPKD